MTKKGFVIYAVVVTAFCILSGYLMLSDKESFMRECREAGYKQHSCDVLYDQGPPRVGVPRP